jgi:hypothetical protein
MSKKIAGALILTALVAVGLVVAVGAIAAGGTGGRQLDGGYCTNPQALPKAGACIALSFGDQTASGYTNSPDRVLSLRPGTYWLTVNDNSAAHNFSFQGPDGVAQTLTGVPDTPGLVTFKVHLTHGEYSLFCDPHRAFGMFVVLDVGGEGQ